ncbi:peptide-N(4)-(N-acetyl-beta-glucosaminyl)asparagine amidase [Danaus plexippus]|uniref:peptide-N(4)-(N-acetyl-beta- glucosaminyl)asparagine amidase n=1 Tax=Danaus plexippus TaxID=13037 RepID=UPI002AB29FDA|nr:peptide-N(4)-(N-acetyl-beta-glucosaminyl)asparagine amidase [Danaus plexippus]
MEDMARLALVEQSVKDENQYRKILFDLLDHISNILDNPHDYDLRTIKSDILEKVLDCEAFADYLKYIGFQMGQKEIMFPREQTLSKLRIAQAALERKIGFCCGNLNKTVTVTDNKKTSKPKLTEANVLVTNNSFLLRIQSLFNDMIRYEDEELQQRAREHIPLVTLQLMALDRMREHQKKIKMGEIKDQDMSFDMALLMELIVWFKNKFFTWVDQPACDKCGRATSLVSVSSVKTDLETCRAELYKCSCGRDVLFPRYNNPITLLRTRRGRCGEWANCFTLMCRALGYDTRYVYDTTDHVWCEVFDQDSQRWLHVDPCEGCLNAPLMYEHGWGKSLTYIIAVSRDDLQDVTWRYSSHHKALLQRRDEVSEADLVLAILALRDHRHDQVSPARRRYLVIRTLKELVELMVERKPGEMESHGRISGSKAWRMERGETGARKHAFILTEPGDHCVQYRTSSDTYRVLLNNVQRDEIKSWRGGVFHSENMFRKLETDWQQTYLAREEGENTGSISWKLMVEGDLMISSVAMDVTTAQYEDGRIEWTYEVDHQPPRTFSLNAGRWQIDGRWSSCEVRARLVGGKGVVAWQHAQIARQHASDDKPALSLLATVVPR